MLCYYIVGTKHLLQRRDLGLKAFLECVLSTHSVALIAEEALASEPKLVGRDLGREHNIPWIPVDMTVGQQEQAGIAQDLDKAYRLMSLDNKLNLYPKHANDVRHEYWLQTIEGKCLERKIEDGTILVTCGRNHLEFFSEEVRKRGIKQVEIAEYPEGLKATLPQLTALP
jgi:hypothetical protein